MGGARLAAGEPRGGAAPRGAPERGSTPCAAGAEAQAPQAAASELQVRVESRRSAESTMAVGLGRMSEQREQLTRRRAELEQELSSFDFFFKQKTAYEI